MTENIELIPNGGVTSPAGYLAGGAHAGLKSAGEDVLDLGILVSEHPAAVAGTYSTNAVLSPSVTVTRSRAAGGSARGVVANSGCANCAVGSQGVTDAEEMAAIAAAHASVGPEQMLVCSTGVIGMELPMALIRSGMSAIQLSREGGNAFARSVMTTDTRPKSIAVAIDLDGRRITVGGAAKGAAMIHPNMATMLAFVTTDAAVEDDLLKSALKDAVDLSFNMIDVDSDQSTNDTVLLFANGAEGGAPIRSGTHEADAFKDALTYVCTGLAQEMVRDAEGGGHLIEVSIVGARTDADARLAAREVSSSMLVKAMVHGRDPNWGRIMMAIGNSGAEVVEDKVDVFINDIHMVHVGIAIPYFAEAVVSSMASHDVKIRVDLNVGSGVAVAWGSDLTEEYVTLNSAYTT